MKPGDLVHITRPMIGLRSGSIGLILEEHEPIGGFNHLGYERDYSIFEVHIVGSVPTRVLRFLSHDLEVLQHETR